MKQFFRSVRFRLFLTIAAPISSANFEADFSLLNGMHRFNEVIIYVAYESVDMFCNIE